MSLRNGNVSTKDKIADTQQRKGRSSRDRDASVSVTKLATHDNKEKEETILKTFLNHPFGVVFILFVAVYLVNNVGTFLVLKHPEVFTFFSSRMVFLRPPVRQQDPRQFMMLGCMGSGTDKVAEKMAEILGMEIGLETVDAESSFVRDGTVSSFYGIRYAPLPDEKIYYATVLKEMCVTRSKDAQNAFRIRNYRLLSNCSYFMKWSKCHATECLNTLSDEWSCAWKKSKAKKSCPSFPATARVLHLLRHPVRNIQDLMSKKCPRNATNPHPSFRQMALPWLNQESSNTSCLGQVAWYVVNYNQYLLNAKDLGHIDYLVKYEETSLCDIANVAGFRSSDTVIYDPNKEKIDEICGDDMPSNSTAKQKLSDIGEKLALGRDNSPNFGWTDIRSAGGKALENSLRKLCKQTGYDISILDQKTKKNDATKTS